MRKVALLILVVVMSFTNQGNVFAASEDEQWPIPNEPAVGHHSVLIGEQADGFKSYSQLSTQYEKGYFLCKSVSDENCSKGWYYNYNAVLPVCDIAAQVNCIEGLSARKEGGEVKVATFDQYTYENHPNMYVGDVSKGIPMAGAPSIWKLPGMPHSGGDEYALVAGLSGNLNKTDTNYVNEDFYLHLAPVSRKSGISSDGDDSGFNNYNKCIQKISPEGIGSLACGGGVQDVGKFKCAVKTDKASDCYLQRPFPADTRFEVRVRLAKEPISWMHGRMFNPTIEVKSLSTGGVKLTVEAGSVKVPIFYSGGQFSTLDKELQEYWDKCIPIRTCGFSTRSTSNFAKEPNGNLRNVQDNAESYGDRALGIIKTFVKSASDKSVAVPTTWNIRSLTKTEMSKANGCFNSGSGIKGIVTTNSTTYSEGPPTFSDGFLNYKVASAHFNPDGTEFKGTYNLVIRSDVARCLYKFSSAPLSASIQVVTDNGEPSVSTTLFGERKGWVELAAYNFEFSSPTVRVKLEQEASIGNKLSPKVSVKKSSITCVKGKSVKKVTAQKPKCPTGYKKR
ncbi:hypothetical protein MCEMRE130_01137 [Candidatus Nanopelagicaceae bacterium]